MAKSTLRVAVIGAGAIAQARHLPEYASRRDVDLVAVVDINRKRAAGMAEKYGIANVFTRYQDALQLGPDAVSVCTPNALHAEMTVAALKAKAHVLCEKPMALSLAEVRAMNRAAKANRRQLMIGHNQRFAVAHVKGKEIYQSGALGKCLSFTTTFAHAGPEGWSIDGLNCFFFKKRLAGLGSMADLGVHKLDLLRWLLEDEFVQASAMYDTVAKAKCNVEDTAYAVLRTAKGAMGQMWAGWTHTPGCDNSTVLYCENGILRLESDPAYPVIVEKPDGERQYIKVRAIQTNEAGGQYSSGVIDAFVDSLQAGRKVPVPGEEGGRSLAAVLACIESGKRGRTTRVAKM